MLLLGGKGVLAPYEEPVVANAAHKEEEESDRSIFLADIVRGYL
jgi:hypothetical protein